MTVFIPHRVIMRYSTEPLKPSSRYFIPVLPELANENDLLAKTHETSVWCCLIAIQEAGNENV